MIGDIREEVINLSFYMSEDLRKIKALLGSGSGTYVEGMERFTYGVTDECVCFLDNMTGIEIFLNTEAPVTVPYPPYNWLTTEEADYLAKDIAYYSKMFLSAIEKHKAKLESNPELQPTEYMFMSAYN